MIDERSEAEASLYVLGALPAEEVREFERAMRADLELQLLVNELRAAADTLVVALPRRDPPPPLKQRLLESIDRQEGFAGAAAGGNQLEPPAWQSWMPWALAASFALLCLLLIALGNSLRRQATEARQQLNDQLAGQQREQNNLRTQAEQKAAAYQQQLTELQKQIVRKAEDFERQRQAVEKESENKVLIVQREKKGAVGRRLGLDPRRSLRYDPHGRPGRHIRQPDARHSGGRVRSRYRPGPARGREPGPAAARPGLSTLALRS